MSSTGKWARADVPHEGWECVDVHDLGDLLRVCEMCEVKDIRYVHVMEHDDYDEPLHVGCICAGHMEGDADAAREREDDFRRKSRWVAREWRESAAGNQYLNADGFNVVIYPVDRGWSARIAHRITRRTRKLEQPCATEEAAKLAAFDVMKSMQRLAAAR